MNHSDRMQTFCKGIANPPEEPITPRDMRMDALLVDNADAVGSCPISGKWCLISGNRQTFEPR